MRFLSLLSGLFLLPAIVFAQDIRPSDAVLDALQLDRLLGILQSEAVASGDELFSTIAGERSGDGWAQVMARITAPETLAPTMRDDFARAMAGKNVAPIREFWESADGQKIVSLELSAREALADPDLEAAMLDRFDGLERNDTSRVRLLRRFVEVNDLIDSNVASAMNGNAAFLRGLRDGAPDEGFAPGDDSAIMAEVWAQEDEIRESTEDWINAFISLAYQPLGDDALIDYIEFSETDAGQSFNNALFQAFDSMFATTSRQTGEALARFLASEDI